MAAFELATLHFLARLSLRVDLTDQRELVQPFDKRIGTAIVEQI